jgi:hypothetical protein
VAPTRADQGGRDGRSVHIVRTGRADLTEHAGPTGTYGHAGDGSTHDDGTGEEGRRG